MASEPLGEYLFFTNGMESSCASTAAPSEESSPSCSSSSSSASACCSTFLEESYALHDKPLFQPSEQFYRTPTPPENLSFASLPDLEAYIHQFSLTFHLPLVKSHSEKNASSHDVQFVCSKHSKYLFRTKGKDKDSNRPSHTPPGCDFRLRFSCNAKTGNSWKLTKYNCIHNHFVNPSANPRLSELELLRMALDAYLEVDRQRITQLLYFGLSVQDVYATLQQLFPHRKYQPLDIYRHKVYLARLEKPAARRRRWAQRTVDEMRRACGAAGKTAASGAPQQLFKYQLSEIGNLRYFLWLSGEGLRLFQAFGGVLLLDTHFHQARTELPLFDLFGDLTTGRLSHRDSHYGQRYFHIGTGYISPTADSAATVAFTELRAALGEDSLPQAFVCSGDVHLLRGWADSFPSTPYAVCQWKFCAELVNGVRQKFISKKMNRAAELFQSLVEAETSEAYVAQLRAVEARVAQGCRSAEWVTEFIRAQVAHPLVRGHLCNYEVAQLEVGAGFAVFAGHRRSGGVPEMRQAFLKRYKRKLKALAADDVADVAQLADLARRRAAAALQIARQSMAGRLRELVEVYVAPERQDAVLFLLRHAHLFGTYVAQEAQLGLETLNDITRQYQEMEMRGPRAVLGSGGPEKRCGCSVMRHRGVPCVHKMRECELSNRKLGMGLIGGAVAEIAGENAECGAESSVVSVNSATSATSNTAELIYSAPTATTASPGFDSFYNYAAFPEYDGLLSLSTMPGLPGGLPGEVPSGISSGISSGLPSTFSGNSACLPSLPELSPNLQNFQGLQSLHSHSAGRRSENGLETPSRQKQGGPGIPGNPFTPLRNLSLTPSGSISASLSPFLDFQARTGSGQLDGNGGVSSGAAGTMWSPQFGVNGGYGGTFGGLEGTGTPQKFDGTAFAGPTVSPFRFGTEPSARVLQPLSVNRVDGDCNRKKRRLA